MSTDTRTPTVRQLRPNKAHHRAITTVGLLALTSTGCYSVYRAPVSEVFTREMALGLPAVDPACIEVHLRGGHVLIRDGAEFEGEAAISVLADSQALAREKAEEIEIHITETGGVCQLRITHPTDTRLDAVDVRYRLRVPESVKVRVFTLDARVAVRGYRGEIEVRTDSGNIHARPGGGSCTLRSRAGAVRLEGSYRSAVLESQSGGIEATVPVDHSETDLRATSGTGPVLFDMFDDRRMDLSYTTGNGNLRTSFPVVWNTNGEASKKGRLFRGTVGDRGRQVTVRAIVQCDAASFEVRRILYAAIPSPEDN